MAARGSIFNRLSNADNAYQRVNNVWTAFSAQQNIDQYPIQAAYNMAHPNAQASAGPALAREPANHNDGHGPGSSHIYRNKVIVPTFNEATLAKKTRKFLSRVEQSCFGQMSIEEVQKDIEEEIARIEERGAPGTIKKRNQIKDDWSVFLKSYMEKGILDEDLFRSDKVAKWAVPFLRMKVELTDPAHKSNPRLRSSTLVGWCAILTSIIVKYTWKYVGQDRVRCGMEVLISGDLYDQLRDTVAHLVSEYELVRHMYHKWRCGRAEVEALIIHVLKKSQHPEAQRVVINRIISLLLMFYTTCRISTLGPSNEKYRSEGKFPRVRDVTVERLVGGEERAVIRYTNFKGSNGVEGSEQVLVLSSATKVHNALFDIVFWIKLDGICRGILVLPTFSAIQNSDWLILEYRPDNLDDPLFLEARQGGLGFSNAKKAAMSNKMGRTISGWMSDLNPQYADIIGKDFAKDLMHHVAQYGTFTRHYSENTTNFDLVPAHLRERTFESQYYIRSKKSASLAVVARLGWQDGIGNNLEDDDRGEGDNSGVKLRAWKAPEEVVQWSESQEDVVELKAEISQLWPGFLEFFNDTYQFIKGWELETRRVAQRMINVASKDPTSTWLERTKGKPLECDLEQAQKYLKEHLQPRWAKVDAQVRHYNRVRRTELDRDELSVWDQNKGKTTGYTLTEVREAQRQVDNQGVDFLSTIHKESQTQTRDEDDEELNDVGDWNDRCSSLYKAISLVSNKAGCGHLADLVNDHVLEDNDGDSDDDDSDKQPTIVHDGSDQAEPNPLHFLDYSSVQNALAEYIMAPFGVEDELKQSKTAAGK
ncbi:hypothetical protein VNI00_018319 [Paramarasmius palmivorus]|uniref:Uncharacterized protein n=1 Tax=Paramarasmius palmivorus TaxID=297713 RepID=A0AAW0B102_9AGAR